MKKVEISEKHLLLFQEYQHSIPVIYSVLEGQYDGKLFVDSEHNTQMAVLFTPFAFHFVAGNAEFDNVVEVLDQTIFQQYLAETGEKEAIVFCPDQQWDKVLDEVFAKHHGVKDSRKIFYLNRDRFAEAQASRIDLHGLQKTLQYEQENGAKSKYLVCRILDGEACISYCSGFMSGRGHAEIDVFTEECYREKGYAREASITLIRALLASGIEPDWCTWPYRTESEKLALSIGYELKRTVPAHIWIENE